MAYYLWARPQASDEAWAQRLLPPALGESFARMGAPDRAHALRVARRLELLGAPQAVLELALLHDLAKPAEVGLLGRVAHVLWPAIHGYWPAAQREAMGRFAKHEAESLRMAEAGAASPGAIAMMKHLNGEGPDPDPIWTKAFLLADEKG